MNGRELLTKIKTDSILKAIPTIVLSVSNDPDDIEYCYQNGANAYLIKPPNIDEFNRLAEVVNTPLVLAHQFPGREGKDPSASHRVGSLAALHGPPPQRAPVRVLPAGR